MYLDQAHFPIVFLREEGPSEMPLPHQLVELLAAGKKFVLITHHRLGEGHDETHEERKERALFFKQIRKQLHELCRGIIFIQGDRPFALPVRAAAQTFVKALGMTVAFVADEQAAVQQGNALL
ncbi:MULTISPECIES: hypothetical protein [unclassified Beijerinckia]|uniref:hypothetical protein n=1 Tax=unclassified Beijerinckia TaxID=2638183 RepID=UPI0008973AD2|nr:MULTISPECIES: hypothetical protein [unclassified Beijerinckia]MDH7795104.1 hypothetical protein [Beijerinckia sp. GAS462]SEB87711.1 hypothetical protein SAMN05443249_1375 [Beijerinckia sp. 28-YEA-48]